MKKLLLIVAILLSVNVLAFNNNQNIEGSIYKNETGLVTDKESIHKIYKYGLIVAGVGAIMGAAIFLKKQKDNKEF